MQEREFALEVTLSDESKYTVYRTTKDIAKFHVSTNRYTKNSFSLRNLCKTNGKYPVNRNFLCLSCANFA